MDMKDVTQGLMVSLHDRSGLPKSSRDALMAILGSLNASRPLTPSTELVKQVKEARARRRADCRDLRGRLARCRRARGRRAAGRDVRSQGRQERPERDLPHSIVYGR